ncbi:MAG: hypothetical protein KDD78_04420 [Caldilineaceae bacterium]|nr:hypothetical protein [Caldilineaceae bacterium]
MTDISIADGRFYLNGELTYKDRVYRDYPIEGLLLNTRMVQATFDDTNPATRHRWAYPDTGVYDAERNVQEFLAALPIYRDHGVLAVTVNFQGGSPEGYSKEQPWINTAFTATGEFKPDYLDRMGRILDRLNELGMVAIVGLFYFGQDERLQDEKAVIHAVDNSINWFLQRGDGHVLVEINNECDVPRYEHEILQPHRVHELVEHAKGISLNGRRLPVGLSFKGNSIPTEAVVRASDLLLLHGNGVSDPNRIAAMVRETRQVPGYQPMPILFNEDDHFNFDQPWNNFVAAISEYASWGFFDPGQNDYSDGYQSPPVAWGLSTPRKQAFFQLAKEIAG